jgi:Icc-related predicted phosphoesterase
VARVRFACIGDAHHQLERVERVAAWLARRRWDVLLLTGDFAGGPYNRSTFGTADDSYTHVLDLLAPLDRPIFFVPGNHDASNIDAPENIDGRLIQVEGIRLFGIGGGGPTVFGFPYEWTDEEMEGVQIPDCDLLLSHSPPASTPCDLTRRGAHAGSRVIRRELERAARAMVCGHIHEAVGFAFVGGKLCYNAGTLGEPFGRLQVGILTFERGGRTSIEHHVLDSLPPQGTRGG